ncbi:hypothetical protein FOL47_008266 [Perkinsus chesapeaki]|uniref:Uncharacterized protein n=1 Tax=Perkinsus chesapeaki TaxID=330153 RepID=A0A7J6MW30_PERCH|nr:hypothetical protein FOL47_008266 [Perkinsus chesapeaki]
MSISSTELHVRRRARQRVVAVLLWMKQSLHHGERSPLLDCLSILWEFALPVVVAYERAPGIDLGSTTARVLFGKLSSGRCLMLSDKVGQTNNYLLTEVDLNNGTLFTRTILNPLNGARVREFCPDTNTGRLYFVGYHSTGSAIDHHPERVGYTNESWYGDTQGVSHSNDVTMTAVSAPLTDCRFDHSLSYCCCQSGNGSLADLYCISSPLYHTDKRFITRIHLQPSSMFGRSENLLEVTESVREMKVSSLSGVLTILLLARGDDRDGSPVILSWQPGGELIKVAVMDSFHVRFDIGGLYNTSIPEALLLLDGHFPGRKLRALNPITGEWVYEVDAPKGSDFSAWFFLDSSASGSVVGGSRISVGLLWGTAKLRNSCQLLCWAPRHQ